MKTSNKLLLGFAGILVLFMLFSAIVLKANYNKGITNTNRYEPSQDPDYAKLTIPAFKALVLTSTSPAAVNHGATIHIHESQDYSLEFFKNVTYRSVGDTLYLDVSKSRDITLYCPAISYINNKSLYDISLDETKAPQVQINSNSYLGTYLNNTKINSFSFTGDYNTTLNVNESSELDSVRITMGKAGNLNFYAPYKYADFQVDSLDNLNLSGKSIQGLKRINNH